jgi:ABC-type transporter Mla MlaB component
MTENFNIEYKSNKGELDIILSGQLTIVSIKKITESVKTQLNNKPKKVSITVNDVENIDLTFVQLLQSIKNSGVKNGFEVEVSLKLPDDLSSLIKNAGFGSFLNANK